MRYKKWWGLSGIFLLVLLATGFNGFFTVNLLKMHLRPQHRDFWCWAASTEMISEYLGRRISQCDSVSYVSGAAYCTESCECESGWGPFFGAGLEMMKHNWRHWDFKFKHLAGPLGWSDLTDDISRVRCPIFAAWYWVGGGGHILVVHGYAQPRGRLFSPRARGFYVFYLDPWPPDCEPGDGYYSCTSVPGGDLAVSTYEAFVDDGVHFWGDTLHLFINLTH